MVDYQVLKYLIEIADAGSISRAAQNLYTSQSNLSKVVSNYEKCLGFKIFRRTTKGVEPTNEGRKFLRMAQNILWQTQILEDTYYHCEDNRLNASISVTRSYQILKTISSYVQKNKDLAEINIRFKECDPFRVIEDVASGASGFGVSYFFESQEPVYIDYIKSQELVPEKFFTKEYKLLMSENNPLATKDEVTKEDIQDQLAVLYGDYENTWMSYQSISDMSDIVFSPKRIYFYDRGSTYDFLQLYPKSYHWVAGLSPDTLDKNHLVLKPCKDVHVSSVGVIIHRKDTVLQPCYSELENLIRKIDWTERID